jgi:hypothetical protein
MSSPVHTAASPLAVQHAPDDAALTVHPSAATLDEVLAECRGHMDNMLEVLKSEFKTASALSTPDGSASDSGAVGSAVRVMLGAVQERLALDKMWFIRLTALQMGVTEQSQGGKGSP